MTREDHSEVSNQMYANYAIGKDVQAMKVLHLSFSTSQLLFDTQALKLVVCPDMLSNLGYTKQVLLGLAPSPHPQ